MNFKQGDRVDAINESGHVIYTGVYLASGRPTKTIIVEDPTHIHHAIQVNDKGDTVYVDASYWTLRNAR